MTRLVRTLMIAVTYWWVWSSATVIRLPNSERPRSDRAERQGQGRWTHSRSRVYPFHAVGRGRPIAPAVKRSIAPAVKPDPPMRISNELASSPTRALNQTEPPHQRATAPVGK